MQKNILDIQLKDAGQLTGINWAAWLESTENWKLLGSYKFTQKQYKELLKLIGRSEIRTWINNALASKSIHSRTVPKGTSLAGQRMYVFPNRGSKRVLLVGGGKISGSARRLWQGLSERKPGNSVLDHGTLPSTYDTDLVPYHLPRSLDRIMELITKTADCNGGCLAIRSGDYLVIKAQANGSKYLDQRFPLSQNPLLQEIVLHRKYRMLNKTDPLWKVVPRMDFKPSTKVWFALPLIIGKRVIGLVAVWSSNQFPQENINRLQLLVERAASAVEGNIAFSELSGHLHRLAYLNDFAVTVFASVNMEQIVQRTFALLSRAFNTSRTFIKLLVPNGTSLQFYADQGETIRSKKIMDPIIPTEVEKGQIYHPDLIVSDTAYKVVYKGSKSVLMTPIKYQKKVIGVLGLESDREGAFTVNDEHLIAVIASYIAGFIENNLLREEAETRVRNLNLIHEVVEQVIGQTDVRQVAQAAAELMAHNFDYERVAVALVRGPKKELQVAGIGGKIAEDTQHNLKAMNSQKENSVAVLVAETGKSILVNNGHSDSVGLPGTEWRNKSGMCVALKEGEQSFGIIEVMGKENNVFTKNDLIVLESLGGILASVISNVGQYQKLQMTVKQLRATQDELQEHIAAQQMAERRLVQAAKLAAVGEMAAGIAHELNNPLTTVTGFTELTMEEVSPDSRVHADLELVLREAHRATDVVRRLLDFARQSDSVRTHSDMNEIVNEVLALVNHLMHSNGVALITDLSKGLPTISVDRNQIKQVILNLIHNALHAMTKGGELRISTNRQSRDHQDWVTVVVTDSGVGIAPENMERIFEPFFTTRAKEGGTGLGLSISYGIVAEHGGFIEAESKLGKGSIFSIWIPVEVN